VTDRRGVCDYYTSTVVEVLDTSLENRRPLFGDGRYTKPVHRTGDTAQIPEVGFGMGDVTSGAPTVCYPQHATKWTPPPSGRRIAGRILGREERAVGTVTIRNMMTGNRHPPAPPPQW
jgi:histidyl-tRNA synthetase